MLSLMLMYVSLLCLTYQPLVITAVLDLFVYMMYFDYGRRNILMLLLIENVDGHALVVLVVVVVEIVVAVYQRV